MNRWIKGLWLSLSLICMWVCIGCGKGSGLEGKVVDGKGQPLANLKIIAKQRMPIKGYDQFETMTGSDGKFYFGKLYPNSAYVLSVWYKDWITNANMEVTTVPEGETCLLKDALVIRFLYFESGIIKDFATGLEWYVGPDEYITWDEAKSWVEGLTVAGGGWRMPTRHELKGFYENGGHQKFGYVWSGEIRDSEFVWFFDFHGGSEQWTTRSPRPHSPRVFAVRSGR